MKLKQFFTAVFAAMTVVTVLPACSPMRESPGEYVDDTVVTSRVKAALASDPVVKATQVQVETYKGVVQLSGFVDSSEAVKRAGEVARGVKGAREVKNNVMVAPK